MKAFITLFLVIVTTFTIQSQSLVGSWESTTTQDGEQLKSVVIFTEGYQVITTFNAKTGAFINTNGGKWSIKDDVVTEVVEFDSAKPERVGENVSFKIALTNDTMSIIGRDQIFKRIDNGTPGALQNAWLMSGRKRDGEIQSRDTSRPRKTMKILSGTRFQWIAYNTETKQFMGTGGGNYTTIDGKYTENIEFFSRDDSRVGASLQFDYELMDGDWHHSGLSSKGAPIYEIWSVRKE